MASLKDDTVIQLQRISTICKLKVPVVVVWCMTYNHANYIKDALDGFVTQIASFPFIVIVHDDASSDKTSEIVREYGEKYPDIISPIIETENQYSKSDGSLDYIMKAAIKATGAKYIAMCEGDDYWTDPLKLQKQVDFLEANPEYGMIYTKIQRFYQASGKLKEIWGGNHESFSDLLRENTIPTLSVLIIRDIFIDYQKEIKPEIRDWKMGDYPLWLYVSAKSRIKFLSKVTGVYRVLEQSASHNVNRIASIDFGLNYRKIAYFFAMKYGDIQDCLLTRNNLAWIQYIHHVYIGNVYLAKKISKHYLISKQNSIMKNVFFLVGLFSVCLVRKLYDKLS